MGLFSGLEKFGFQNEDMQIYESRMEEVTRQESVKKDAAPVVIKENEYLFIFNSNYGIPSLAKALNIPKHIITDVSCQDAGDLDFIIPLDKVRKEC